MLLAQQLPQQLTFPGFQEPYLKGQESTTVIEAPEGFAVKLVLQDSGLELSQNCERDSVTVSWGPGGTSGRQPPGLEPGGSGRWVGPGHGGPPLPTLSSVGEMAGVWALMSLFPELSPGVHLRKWGGRACSRPQGPTTDMRVMASGFLQSSVTHSLFLPFQFSFFSYVFYFLPSPSLSFLLLPFFLSFCLLPLQDILISLSEE